MKRLLLILLLPLTFSGAFGQDNLDSNRVLENAKLVAFIQGGFFGDNFKELESEIATTSARFLDQSGFSNVLFIKVKVRPRKMLEYKVFNSCLTDSENHHYAGQAAIATEIIRDKIFKCYNITKNTPNDSLEAILNTNPDYNIYGFNCIMAFVILHHRFIILRDRDVLPSGICDLNYFRSLIKKGEIVDPLLLDKKEVDKGLTEKRYEEILKKLKIEKANLGL
ncbi:MAG: hypothetical protein BGO70_18460 [Bacteroidetes bacterium 43-93]|nr:hypothetical protein [Bacteroidota bacterium]OJX01712.1 MAG: hypothetical protein BGO70_18460 [Bacteroidetes bacterium 43-93]